MALEADSAPAAPKFHFSRFANGAGPSVADGVYRLLDAARTHGQSNAIAFDRAKKGAYETTSLSCRLRVKKGGDGGAFVFLSTAEQGVRVELILPAKVDSLLVRYSSRSNFIDLMQAGVRIQEFSGGLLHTKSITVDGRMSMFGTVNLDMRSLWLNYEVSLFVYGDVFGKALRDLQQSYLEDCTLVDLDAWLMRPVGVRFIENVARLLSPLL